VITEHKDVATPIDFPQSILRERAQISDAGHVGNLRKDVEFGTSGHEQLGGSAKCCLLPSLQQIRHALSQRYRADEQETDLIFGAPAASAVWLYGRTAGRDREYFFRVDAVFDKAASDIVGVGDNNVRQMIFFLFSGGDLLFVCKETTMVIRRVFGKLLAFGAQYPVERARMRRHLPQRG